ncbi:unnamed protein product [Candida verbasci]|uniref:Bms1-type G domain-containing protein n=1 Tax=Candida verbasci TaxID=1227364 RepID=A0A9W4TUN1_9ASCO|nr:unnamed protein product [Candida verbasci]
MAKGGNSHRSTLKNDHKPFKSRHTSKGQLKNKLKGKVEKSTNSDSNSSHKSISKIQRKNINKQLKETKILETKLIKKIYEGNSGIEKIITIICLTEDLSPIDIANQIFNQDETTNFEFNYPSVSNIHISKFKTNLKVIIPDHTNILNLLDAAKCSNFIIFGFSATEEVGDYGETILRSLIAQGISNTFGVIPNLISTYPNSKKNLQLDIKQSLQSYYNYFFPGGDDKLYATEVSNEIANLLRNLCQRFPNTITWRDSRGWLISETVKIENEYLVVEGVVRGQGFNSNRLVHIPGFGDFQVDKIEKLQKRSSKNSMDLDNDVENEFIPNENRDTLDELNSNDEEIDMDHEDYENYDGLGVRSEGKIYFNDDGTRRAEEPKKLPKGTSEYQSRWFVDDVLDENDSDLEEEQVDEDEADEEDMVDIDTQTEYTENDIHVDLSQEEEERQLQEYRNLVKEDMEFPDEIELHPQESAIEKFKDYRGVKSLSNCDWDVNEQDIEKPSIWNKLFKVGNFKTSKNKINKEFIKNVELNQGDKIRLFIKAPLHIIESFNPQVKPFVIYELFEHEHKLSVLNFSFENWEDYDESVPNKDTMVIQYGPRRQIINPIFNQGSNNKNNVHKTENFVHKGNTVVASCIAPILFTNSPVIYFKPNAEGNGVEFIGQGSYLGSDNSRILVKRVVLTGHPVKIHKRVVTVRYMFFNKDDINYFKAIQLFTKSGRSGFIKESLGTHGYFKANFDGKLTSQDIVGMSLYRRVWPEISSLYNE